jgi:hypothetical protein
MSTRKKRNGQFTTRPVEMLQSPAWRVLSLTGHRILDRIELELANHRGKDNGQLPVTYADFIRFGIHHNGVGPGIREVEALGFIEITRHGTAGNAEYRTSSLYRITYQRQHETNEWARIKTMEEAQAIAARVRTENFRTLKTQKPHPEKGCESTSFSHPKNGSDPGNFRTRETVVLSRHLPIYPTPACASSRPADEPRQPAAQPQNTDPWADLGIPEFLRRYS